MRSPVSGTLLKRDGDVLRGDGEVWPVVDGIAFLRADRAPLAREAAGAILQGDMEAARVLLLGDQDGWAPDPPPDEASRRELARNVGRLSFRDALRLLAFGPVATYFEHRWSDPTFLSGLALAEAHWGRPRRVLELAAGAGHFLREFARTGADVLGADIVFSKLWLARHYVAPGAALVCFDASAPWPVADNSADAVFCHDAFYFLAEKPHIASEIRRVAGPAGRILIGHAHNALVDNLSAGAPLSPEGYAALFDDPTLYDDRELTEALVEARAPEPASAEALHSAPAIAIAAGQASRERSRPLAGGLTMPPAGTVLRRNPLYAAADGPARIAWPSARYRREYGSLATYPEETNAPSSAVAGAVADALVRRRVFVDLPQRW